MKLSMPKTVAIGTWAIGPWATYQFISVLSNEEAVWILIAAIFMQALFTATESALWNGNGSWFSISILLIDALTNIGGLYAYIRHLDRTKTWAAFAEALGLSGGMSPLSTLILAGVVGIFLAAAPEMVWRQGNRNG